jgi:hypothetical protein
MFDPFFARIILGSAVGLTGDTVINALPDSANIERLGVAAVTVSILIVICYTLWKELKKEREASAKKDEKFISILNKISSDLDNHHSTTMDHFRRGDSKRYVTPLPVRGQSDGV